MKLGIEMESDWHVGEGAGRPGSVDRLVRRRAPEGLPYLPAKTIIGVWRDACEAVAEGLDGGRPGAWSDWVEAIFGSQPALARGPSARSPVPARLKVGPALFPERIARALENNPALRSAVTFIKPGVRIDPESGQALDKHLRFVEMVRGGIQLEAPVELEESGWDPVAREAAVALLWAGARVVGRIGGGRRRGSGACKFVLEGIPDEQRLLRVLRGDPPTALPPDPVAVVPETPRPSTNSWVEISLRLVLQAPVVIPRAVTGNVVEGLDFIPGTFLLGPVLGLLRKVVGEEAGALARAGDMRVLHAYPEVGGRRSRPVPLSWFESKDRDRRMDALQGELPPETQWKQIREGYLAFRPDRHRPQGETGVPAPVRPRSQHATHCTVEDEPQRPTEKVGGVFTYQALAAGQVFRTALRLPEETVRQWDGRHRGWRTSLRGEIRLGISKKDDYGRVLLESVSPEPAEGRGLPSPGEVLDVYLLSETLLRDEALRWDPSLDRLERCLEEELGTELERLGGFASARRLEGWNVSWGLPRESRVGLAAGTCARFRVRGPSPDPEKLRELEERGIGERTAEGFGEISFRRGEPVPAEERRGTSPDEGSIDGKDPSFNYARLLEREAWRGSIQRLAEALAADPGKVAEHLGWRDHSPPNSQLGGLRQAVLSGRLEDWVRGLKGSESRRKLWPAGSLDRLEGLRGKIWEILRGLDPSAFPTVTRTGTEDLERDLRGEAVRGLLLAAIRHTQRRREKKGGRS